MKDKLSLYIHIPFCIKKCLYCDFPSYGRCEKIFDKYTKSLLNEFNEKLDLLKDYKISTIFIGGGTPTVLPPENIFKIMDFILNKLDVEENAEITIEANPGTIDSDKLKKLRGMNINRISMGLQAWQNKHLKNLGRIYTIDEFKNNFYEVREAGFSNVNLDIMFALPEQSLFDWYETLENVISLKPEHISAYSLILEEGTPFFDMYSPIDENLDRKMYHDAVEMLEKNGYKRYEISNFAKEGFRSRHNMVYWQTLEYIGLGLGSHSFFKGSRFHNTYDLDKYIAQNGISLAEDKEVLSDNEKMSEFMFMGLRMSDGVSKDEFFKRFGISMDLVYKRNIKQLIDEKLIKPTKIGYKLTDYGIDISNYVFEKFLI